MKKLVIITVIFYSILTISCNKENTTSPVSDNKFLIVDNQEIGPGEIIRIDDYPLFVMNYNGDYGFHSYLNTGKGNGNKISNILHSDTVKWGCTCFSAMTDSCKIFGRNFDYYHHIALVLYTHSPFAYSSISIADISYLGFSQNTTLDQIKASLPLSGCAYCTMDGLNEKGVSVGMMTVPDVQPPYDPKKINLGCADIIRLILDYASSTDEAVSLIKKYNYIADDNTVHYLIADKNGKSAIIEFINNEVEVIYNTEPFQVSTNFIISGSTAPQSTTCWRYNTAYNTLKNANGFIDNNTAMNILSSVSQNITMWSAVYNMNTFSLDISIGKKYNKVYTIKVQN